MFSYSYFNMTINSRGEVRSPILAIVTLKEERKIEESDLFKKYN